MTIGSAETFSAIRSAGRAHISQGSMTVGYLVSSSPVSQANRNPPNQLTGALPWGNWTRAIVSRQVRDHSDQSHKKTTASNEGTHRERSRAGCCPAISVRLRVRVASMSKGLCWCDLATSGITYASQLPTTRQPPSFLPPPVNPLPPLGPPPYADARPLGDSLDFS